MLAEITTVPQVVRNHCLGASLKDNSETFSCLVWTGENHELGCRRHQRRFFVAREVIRAEYLVA